MLTHPVPSSSRIRFIIRVSNGSGNPIGHDRAIQGSMPGPADDRVKDCNFFNMPGEFYQQTPLTQFGKF